MIIQNLSMALLICTAIFFASCGGKSDATGEVMPIEKVCGYEKWKTVAVEGYLAPNTMSCEKASRKSTSSIVWCFFKVYADKNLSGANISVQIPITSWTSAKNNQLENPPSRAEDLKIYDNDGNLIPPGNKIRVYGELPKSEKCEFGLVKRIDRLQ